MIDGLHQQSRIAAVVLLACIVGVGLTAPVAGSAPTGDASAVAVSDESDLELNAKTAGGELTIGGESDTEVTLPADSIGWEGTVEQSGEWHSSTISVEELTVQGFDVDIQAPDGFEGTYDTEPNVVTLRGTIQLAALGESITVDMAATSEAASGSADIDRTGGTATVVDESFTVDETGSPIVDPALGLPADNPGENELVVSLTIDAESMSAADSADTGDGDSTFDTGGDTPVTAETGLAGTITATTSEWLKEHVGTTLSL